MIRATLLLTALCTLAAGSSGCVSYHVMAHDDASGPDYVVLRSKKVSGREQIYDCYSKPDGKTWKPTCIQVKIRRKE